MKDSHRKRAWSDLDALPPTAPASAGRSRRAKGWSGASAAPDAELWTERPRGGGPEGSLTGAGVYSRGAARISLV